MFRINPETEVPGIFILSKDHNKFTRYNFEMNYITLESLISFETSFRNGSLDPHINSVPDSALLTFPNSSLISSNFHTVNSRLNRSSEDSRRYMVIYCSKPHSAHYPEVVILLIDRP